MTLVKEAIRLMADAAEKLGADADDTKGIIRRIVTAHDLGFNAWFCVCCEIANREARGAGFRGEAHRAYVAATKRTEELRRQLEFRAQFFRVEASLAPEGDPQIRRIQRNKEYGWYWRDHQGLTPSKYYGPFDTRDLALAHAHDAYRQDQDS
jgi:hypothetical protein